MKFQVHMLAFEDGKIRTVNVPDNALTGKTIDEILELIFRYGQNDFQPQNICSVSVGDVIEYKDMFYRVEMTGFEKITNTP